MSKTRINHLHNNWKNVKNKCRTTVNKKYSDIDATSEFKKNILISEHSPIRLLEVDWSWEDIEYWVSTEWSRHKFEKFISTNRDDRTGGNRNKDSQGKPVNFDGYANSQNLIDAWRKRLCLQASKQARELAEDFKQVLYGYEPELSEVLQKNCIYRAGCPEFQSCGYWDNFVKQNKDVDLLNIKERYEAENKRFFKLNDK